MRTSRLFIVAAFVLAALLLPSLASADGITWNISGVNFFIDGGTVTGSFNYNATTNTYSAVNVTSTAGLFLGGTSYSTVTDAILSGSTVLGLGQNPFFDGNLAGQSVLELFFNDPLTNAGGTDQVSVFEVFCTDANCMLPIIRSTLLPGTVTTSPVGAPEPGSLLFLASGLVGLLLLRLRP